MNRVKNCLKFILFFALFSTPFLLGSCKAMCSHEYDEGQILLEADCMDDGLVGYTCTLCGETKKEILPKSDHRGRTVVAPSCTEEGFTTVDCPDCGYSAIENILPARGHSADEGGHLCSVCFRPLGATGTPTYLYESPAGVVYRLYADGWGIVESVPSETVDADVFSVRWVKEDSTIRVYTGTQELLATFRVFGSTLLPCREDGTLDLPDLSDMPELLP